MFAPASTFETAASDNDSAAHDQPAPVPLDGWLQWPFAKPELAAHIRKVTSLKKGVRDLLVETALDACLDLGYACRRQTGYARALECTERTVLNRRRVLEDAGLLHVVDRQGTHEQHLNWEALLIRKPEPERYRTVRLGFFRSRLPIATAPDAAPAQAPAMPDPVADLVHGGLSDLPDTAQKNCRSDRKKFPVVPLKIFNSESTAAAGGVSGACFTAHQANAGSGCRNASAPCPSEAASRAVVVLAGIDAEAATAVQQVLAEERADEATALAVVDALMASQGVRNVGGYARHLVRLARHGQLQRRPMAQPAPTPAAPAPDAAPQRAAEAPAAPEAPSGAPDARVSPQRRQALQAAGWAAAVDQVLARAEHQAHDAAVVDRAIGDLLRKPRAYVQRPAGLLVTLLAAAVIAIEAEAVRAAEAEGAHHDHQPQETPEQYAERTAERDRQERAREAEEGLAAQQAARAGVRLGAISTATRGGAPSGLGALVGGILPAVGGSTRPLPAPAPAPAAPDPARAAEATAGAALVWERLGGRPAPKPAAAAAPAPAAMSPGRRLSLLRQHSAISPALRDRYREEIAELEARGIQAE